MESTVVRYNYANDNKLHSCGQGKLVIVKENGKTVKPDVCSNHVL